MKNLKLGDWSAVLPGVPGSATIGARTYRTITMPGGETWLAENLAYPVPGAVYYEGDESTYGAYGLLYSEDEALAAVSEFGGWRIPSPSEAVAMVELCGGFSVAGGRLKAAGTDYWYTPNTGGTDFYGFGLRGGGAQTVGGDFYYIRETGRIWLSDGSTLSADYASGVLVLSTDVFRRRSVRLVRDTVYPTHTGTHDIVDTNGLAETTESLAQRLDVRLRTFIGEHWLNPELGIPWFEEFLRKSPDLRVCASILSTAISDVPGVTSVLSLTVSVEKATRRMVVSYQVAGVDRLGTSPEVVTAGTVVVPIYVVGDAGEFVTGANGASLVGR